MVEDIMYGVVSVDVDGHKEELYETNTAEKARNLAAALAPVIVDENAAQEDPEDRVSKLVVTQVQTVERFPVDHSLVGAPPGDYAVKYTVGMRWAKGGCRRGWRTLNKATALNFAKSLAEMIESTVTSGIDREVENVPVEVFVESLGTLTTYPLQTAFGNCGACDGSNPEPAAQPGAQA